MKKNRYLLTILGLFLTISCSSIKSTQPDINAINSKKSQKSNFLAQIRQTPPKLLKIYPGHVSYLTISIDKKIIANSLKCNNSSTIFYTTNDTEKNVTLEAIIAESYFSSKKPFNCILNYSYNGKNYNKVVAKVTVNSYKFKEEKLNVDKKRLVLSKSDLARHFKEKAVLKKAYNSSINYPLYTLPFIRPLNSFITSHYGAKRLFNNFKQSQHLGYDFRAKVGTPIPNSNRGKVVFVGDLFFSGKSVLIDHGFGIFTIYSHLSKMQVNTGDIINRGTIVGLSGKTGRVSGPHLHWGVKVNGNWVSGFSLIKESVKQLKGRRESANVDLVSN